jgi:flavin-dependent dehydrogenase
MIPPFTGNGMSMAFEAAELAARPLAEYAAGRNSWEWTAGRLRRGLRDRFRTRLFAARLMHPFLLSPLGRNAIALTSRSGLLPFQTLFRLLR